MRLVVGLGNPGPSYQWTRHNMGFLVVDEFVRLRKKKLHTRIGDCVGHCLSMDGEEVWFVKPQTFMNLSGRALMSFLDQVLVSPQETLIIHDDLDLLPGRLKLKFDGGSGGHHGLESIFQEWRNQNFYRLRIGVGRSLINEDISDYLLTSLPQEEMIPIVRQAIEALELVFRLGPQRAINKINAKQDREEE